jgi:hypothetical protein
MSFAQALNEAVQRRDAAVEQRRHPRNRVLLSAKFVYGEQRQYTPECTIRNLTEAGAAVSFPEGEPLPPVMELVETRSGRAHRAVVIWRRGGFVGLELSQSRDLRAVPAADPVRRLWAVNQLR